MAEYVHTGDKIQASQYNALVDAIVGPTNATTDQPFTQTKNGIVVNNGRNTTQTQSDPTTEPLFNISYGIDKLSYQFDGEDNYFDGIWVKLTSWDKLDNICYHTYMLGGPVYVFLIDDTAQSGKLIWSNGDGLASSTGNLLLPICKVSESAGVATFTIKNESASASLPQIMQTVVVIGNFEKLGCQLGESAIDIDKTSLTNLVRSACPLLNEITGLALRDSRPLYVAPDEDFTANAQPVTYKVGQIQCETLPDSFQGPGGWVGYDIHLSSLAFTPSKQIGANDPAIPTFSYSLFNFDRYPSDISTYRDLSSKGLSCYDVLVKHKKKHPYADTTEIYKNQAEADLEYVAVSCLVPPGDTNANKDGAINTSLSSIDLATIDGNAFYELYGFEKNGTLTESDLSSGGIDVVVRDYFTTGGNGARTNYIPLSGLAKKLSSNVEVDSWATQGAQRSIDWNTQNNKKYLQLYNFDKPGYDDALRVNLVYGQHRYATKYGSGEYPDPYVEFVVRDRNNNIVKYDALDIYAPPISASDITDLCSVISTIVEHDCSCDLGPLSAKVDQLSSQLSNYWKVGGTYNDNCYGQSIGDDSGNPQIDLNNGQLLYSNELDPTVDWHNGYLSWNNGELRLDWSDCKTYDKNQEQAIDWDYRHLYDAAGNVAVRWNNRMLHDSNQLGALDWDYRTLYDSNSHIVADWERKQLLDSNTILAVNWADRHLVDSGQYATLNWQDRMLEGNWAVNGNLSVEQGATLTIGNTTITEAQLQQLLALLQVVPNTP